MAFEEKDRIRYMKRLHDRTSILIDIDFIEHGPSSMLSVRKKKYSDGKIALSIL